MDPMNPQPQPPRQPINMTMPPPMEPAQRAKGSFGPVIGIVIIIALLVLGALYFWGGSLLQEVSPTTDTQQQASDTTEAIEADLTAAADGSFDADLQQLDSELNGL